jgi:DNA-binding transcriptional MerR regulator
MRLFDREDLPLLGLVGVALALGFGGQGLTHLLEERPSRFVTGSMDDWRPAEIDRLTRIEQRLEAVPAYNPKLEEVLYRVREIGRTLEDVNVGQISGSAMTTIATDSITSASIAAGSISANLDTISTISTSEITADAFGLTDVRGCFAVDFGDLDRDGCVTPSEIDALTTVQ